MVVCAWKKNPPPRDFGGKVQNEVGDPPKEQNFSEILSRTELKMSEKPNKDPKIVT